MFDWKVVELCKRVENKREAQTMLSVMRLYAGTSPELKHLWKEDWRWVTNPNWLSISINDKLVSKQSKGPLRVRAWYKISRDERPFCLELLVILAINVDLSTISICKKLWSHIWFDTSKGTSYIGQCRIRKVGLANVCWWQLPPLLFKSNISW